MPFFRFNFVALSFRTDCRLLLMLHSVLSVSVSDSDRFSLLFGESDLSERLSKLSDRFSFPLVGDESLSTKLLDRFSLDEVFSDLTSKFVRLSNFSSLFE